MCNIATEDELHFFLDCAYAVSCWKEVNLWNKLEHKIHQSGSFSSIIFAILVDLDAELQARFVAVLWSLWRTRNECLWEHKQPSTIRTCRLATDLIGDYKWCCSVLAAPQSPSQVLTWEKPEENWLKCNIDGAIFTSEGKFGIGICFRDSHGSLVQAHTMVFPFEVTSTECEASALKHALLIATAYGFERVIFESDCQTVVNAITNDYRYENELGTLLSTCKSILTANASYNIAFVRRQANRVAHNLARASILQSSPMTFYHSPSCISPIIIDEMK
jgi:ribonuclease HI